MHYRGTLMNGNEFDSSFKRNQPATFGLHQVIPCWTQGVQNAPIDYLESAEAETLLQQIDRSTEMGRRDYALFALMLNTGARVQEVLDLKLSDVRTEPPYQVRLRGKGGKVRLCPIWASAAARLRELAQQASRGPTTDMSLFTNRRGRP